MTVCRTQNEDTEASVLQVSRISYIDIKSEVVVIEESSAFSEMIQKMIEQAVLYQLKEENYIKDAQYNAIIRKMRNDLTQ